MEILFLLLGFLLLFAGGKYLVKGSVDIAGHLKISTMVVGVTVVSFGTSAPELLVSLQAILKGHPDISTGNVIGSNISNIALVLGLTALIIPIPVKRNTIFFDWPFMMAVSILFYLFILNQELGRLQGIIMMLLLIGYNYYSIWKSRRNYSISEDKPVTPKLPVASAIFMVIGSVVALVYGSKYLVIGAEEIARDLGVSERAISLSMVAVGTSIPELVTSLAAAIKKELDISIGNIIGSNIFNILGILGTTAIVSPISINQMIIQFDIFWMLGISLLLLVFLLPLKKGKMNRMEGIIYLMIYSIYIYILFAQK